MPSDLMTPAEVEAHVQSGRATPFRSTLFGEYPLAVQIDQRWWVWHTDSSYYEPAGAALTEVLRSGEDRLAMADRALANAAHLPGAAPMTPVPEVQAGSEFPPPDPAR